MVGTCFVVGKEGVLGSGFLSCVGFKAGGRLWLQWLEGSGGTGENCFFLGLCKSLIVTGEFWNWMMGGA